MPRLRKIVPLTLALVFAFFVIAGLSCTPPTSVAPTGPAASGNTWTMTFEDNFDGPTLNTADWNYGWKSTANPTPPVNSDEKACYARDHVQFAYGSLVLHEDQPATPPVCNGTRTYLSGAIESHGKHNFTPGTGNEILMEASIQVDCVGTKIANWPAWWSDGDTGITYNGQTTPNWPAHGEQDHFEGLSGVGEATWHYGTSEADQHHANYGYDPDLGINQCVGFHQYATKWNSDSVTSYLDGVQVSSYTSSTNVYEWPEFLILGNQMSSAPDHWGGPVKTPSNVLVDYVRVYTRAR